MGRKSYHVNSRARGGDGHPLSHMGQDIGAPPDFRGAHGKKFLSRSFRARWNS